MTTEQPPPEPQEHRRSRWWPWDGLGLFARAQPSHVDEADGYAPPGAAGPADGEVAPENAAVGPEDGTVGPEDGTVAPEDGTVAPENGSVIQGEIVSEDERAAREAADQQQQAADVRLPLPPTFRQELRMQLADFAERAHQQRVKRDGAQPLGQGGGITDVVVRAMAEEISAHELPSPVDDQQDRTLLLFGALAAAGIKQKQAHASFVIVRGRLMLDVATSDIGENAPTVRFVRLPDRPGPVDKEAANPDAAGPEAADHITAEHDPTGPDHDGERPTRYAAVICGPAAAIASPRPFLGMDALMTYARRQAVIRSGDAADPQAARRGMRVAHRIEIVVLLDRSLGGGVWVDVDPATGRPAATMSIDLTPTGFEFMPLAAA